MSEVNSTTVPFVVSVQSPPLRKNGDLTQNEREHQWALFTRLAEPLIGKDWQTARRLLLDIMHEAIDWHLYTDEFDEVYAAAYFTCFQSLKPQERPSYKYFREGLQNIIPGATIVQIPTQRDHRPDFFIERDGLISPVEIKKGPFTHSAVKQLQRYMVVYQCQTGYAIAPTLKGKLLAGMMFIQWDGKPTSAMPGATTA